MINLFRGVAALLSAAVLIITGIGLAVAQGSGEIVGTVVRFTSGSTSVDLTIGEDNPPERDFLSLLPVTMTIEEFKGREKIGYFSRKLATEGSPGSDPEDGDLIYFRAVGQYRILLQRLRHRLLGPDDPHRHLRRHAGTTRAACQRANHRRGRGVGPPIGLRASVPDSGLEPPGTQPQIPAHESAQPAAAIRGYE